MLSYLGSAAELAHCKDCKQINNNDLASHLCSTFCPIAHSMTYIASALSPRSASAKSMVSFPSTQSSILEESTPEELSDGEGAPSDTRATSVTTESRAKRTSASSIKNVPKTVFHLAHPPPVSIHKQNLHIRPRVLLQLQKVSEKARPTPVLEVLPSFVFASRLARRFPRTFKGKAGLGADDLVIVNSEDYRTGSSENGELDGIFDGEKWEKREIAAAICQPAKDEVGNQGKAEICLNSGPPWTASRLATGVYEFASVDEHGLRTVARWVPKQPRGTQRTSMARRDRSNSEERKFSFSLLNPNSRRHAIIASLDRHSIEVSSQYTDPPILRRDTDSSTPNGAALDESSPKGPIEVSPALRMLIIVTGIYLSFQEGFSSLFRHSDSTPNSPNLGSKHQRRALSLNGTQFGNDRTLSPTSSTVSNVQRAQAKLQHTNSSSAVPLASSSSQLTAPARRTTSSGGALMQRIRSRNNGAFRSNRLSIGSNFGDSDAERVPTSKDNDQASRASSLYSEASSPGLEDGHDLETVPSSGLDVVHEDSVAAPIATKKSRRLSNMFGLSRKTGRDP